MILGEAISRAEFLLYGEIHIHPVVRHRLRLHSHPYIAIGVGVTQPGGGKGKQRGTPAPCHHLCSGCGSVPGRVGLANTAPCLKAMVSNLPEELISGDLV